MTQLVYTDGPDWYSTSGPQTRIHFFGLLSIDTMTACGWVVQDDIHPIDSSEDRPRCKRCESILRRLRQTAAGGVGSSDTHTKVWIPVLNGPSDVR